jgi:hypothetical protein
MTDGFMDSFCNMLADVIVQNREEIGGLVGRAVHLEDRLAKLESQPDLVPVEIERLRHELAAVDSQLAAARVRLMILESEYNFARNPVLG